MKILRQTDTELVVRDSSLWVSILLALGATLPLGFALFQNDRRGFLAFGCILLFAFPWLRRSTFTFDATSQTIRWIRLRYLRTRTGIIPFSDVKHIDVQASVGGQTNVVLYRLAIETQQGTFPMSDVFNSGENQCASVCEAILRFVKLDRNSVAPSVASALDASARSLLQQGRKIDAIQLVKTSQKLSLTAATQHVNELGSRMHAEK
ncbi:MAG: hypothetical protein WA476_07480 [Acidobacteriaceae bacterium]